MSAQGFVETAPRAFELALHFVSALRQGAFGMVLGHAWAAGHPVVDVSGHELASRADHQLDTLIAGDFSVLAARAWVGTFDTRPVEEDGEPDGGAGEASTPSGEAGVSDNGEGREAVESKAVVDATLAGHAWFAACRLVWRAGDFEASPSGLAHERLVIAVDDPADEALRAYRLRLDDTASQTLLGSVRRAVLRELVLRPAFEAASGGPVTAGALAGGEVVGEFFGDDRHL